MSVSKRDGVWRVQIVYPPDPKTGKMKRRSWTFDSEREAKDFEVRHKAELERLEEQHVRPSVTLVRDYLADWLQRKRAEGLRPKTLYEYESLTRRLIVPSLGGIPLADLSPMRIQQWQDALAPTPDTRGATQAAHAHRTLRSALSDAVRLGMIARNPAQAARPTRRGRIKRDGFTLQQAYTLLAAAEGERHAHLIAFVLYSGLRHGEALGLRWADLDLDAGIITVRRTRSVVGGRMEEGPPKTKASRRTFTMLARAVEALRAQRAQQAEERLPAGEEWTDGDYVFATRTGGGLDQNNVDRAFRRIRDNSNVKACTAADKDPKTTRLFPELPLHSLRHATASILLAATNGREGVCAKMMGHSLEEFSETYADLLQEASRDVARAADAFLDAHAPAAPSKPAEVVAIATGRRGGGRPRGAAAGA